jgi:hypothetical protein
MEIGDVDGVIKKAGLCKRTFEIQEHRRIRYLILAQHIPYRK